MIAMGVLSSVALCVVSLSPAVDLLPVKLPVGIPKPAEGRLVLAGEPMVEVDEGVVTLHILVQSVLQIPAAQQQQAFHLSVYIRG